MSDEGLVPNHFGPADDVFDDKPSMEESDEIPRSGEFQKPISVLNFVCSFLEKCKNL